MATNADKDENECGWYLRNDDDYKINPALITTVMVMMTMTTTTMRMMRECSFATITPWIGLMMIMMITKVFLILEEMMVEVKKMR